MKLYFIKGAIFRQSALTFEQGLAVRGIVGDLVNLSRGDDSITALLEKFVEAGIPQRLFGIILRPLPFLGWWNAFWLKLAGVTPDRPFIMLMPLEATVGVLRDFFTINTRWIPDLSSFTNLSTSILPKIREENP